jgi:menaquinone-dependent protoporphyrinogen IX oxidase
VLAGTTDELAPGLVLHATDNKSGGHYVLAPVVAAHLLLNTFDEVIIGGSIDCLRHDRI